MALFDAESEQIVLGSIIQSPDVFNDVSQIVYTDDFYFEPHRIIYKIIFDLFDHQKIPDAMMVISELKNQNLLEKTGNRSAIIQMAGLSSPIAAPTYASRVRELALRRRLLNEIKEIESSVLNPGTDLNDILSKTEKSIVSISDRHTTYNVRHIRDINAEFLQFLENLKLSKGGITGLATGFHKLDQMTSGFKGGQMIVLAARPGAGKTTLALNMAQYVAMKSQKPILFFSLEMTRLELLLRLVCADAFLESSKIQKGYINEKEMGKIISSVQRVQSADIYVDDSPDLTSWEFRQRCRRLSGQLKSYNKELGLVVVDYLQLMTDKSRGMESRQLEVASISRSLKIIAKELNVPVLAVSQMNRSIEQRGKDTRPQLSDLRESGAIEQDADMVMFIHREDMYNFDLPPEQAGQADIIIAKHRAGPTGSVKLAFLKEKNLFMDTETHEAESPSGDF
ncbi:MAG: replicative DNA helicase [Spirochaetia bacterium]|nr:replicative DNA helicase [Spirochaetia bacterium]